MTSHASLTASVADLAIRPATLDDAAFVADVLSACFRDDPVDPVLMRHEWEVEEAETIVQRFVLFRGSEQVGFAAHSHVDWERLPERFGRLDGELLPALRTAERLEAVFALLEERLRAEGSLVVTAWAWEFDESRLAVLRSRGYREERRERFWELDLAANHDRLAAMAEASRARMREQRVEILTLDRVADPEKYRRLWRMSNEAEQDVPTTEPHTEVKFETFERWLNSPGLREDRIWVARLGDDLVGISMLRYPQVRGVVETDWTATARSVRGRGVARALKCETVIQAKALGVTHVRTDNDGQNAPILHLNETMGYVRRPDMIQLLRPLTS